MSFLSDLFEGHTDKLGTDLTHAPESLAKHPSELYETLGGAAALATGGLALGGLAGDLGGLGFSTLAGTDSAAFDAVGATAAPELAPAVDAVSTGTSVLGNTAVDSTAGLGWPTGNLFGLAPNSAAEAINTAGPALEGDVTGAVGGSTGGTFFDSSAASAAYGGGGGASGAGGGGGFLGSLGQGAINSVTKNPLGIAAAGGLLGYDLLKGNPTDPNQKMLQQEAGQLSAQGQQLQSYLTSGTLPPALKAQLDQATKAEKARIVAGYGSRGQSTDPNQNSALAQELNAVDTNAVAAMASAQIQMLNTGLQETGLSTQLYETLVKLDSAQNDQLMKAISSFAAALGGGGGQTIKLAAA